ncbi:MAG: aldose 1-epimerase [Planctomycetaceae bacterium]|nr:MAG: aldose 1-epimerase [Planctomycetaceae bacterium]
MTVITLLEPSSRSQAKIAPARGFNCFSFETWIGGQWVQVLDAVPDFESGHGKPSGSGIPLLFPFPNRIRGGSFDWQGTCYQLPLNDRFGHAIHGFCHDRPWRVLTEGPQSARAEFQLSVDAPERLPWWPCDFILEVDYELLPHRLRANFRIINPSPDRELPWGLGTHPYFRLPPTPSSAQEHCTVEVPAHEYWVLEQCLPTGQKKPVDPSRDLREGARCHTLQLDDVLTTLECIGPQVEMTLTDERGGIQIVQACSPIFREIVVFTPPARSAICLEPYTCVTDAIHLQQQGIDAGWRVLPPGGEFRTWIDIWVTPVLV